MSNTVELAIELKQYDIVTELSKNGEFQERDVWMMLTNAIKQGDDKFVGIIVDHMHVNVRALLLQLSITAVNDQLNIVDAILERQHVLSQLSSVRCVMTGRERVCRCLLAFECMSISGYVKSLASSIIVVKHHPKRIGKLLGVTGVFRDLVRQLITIGKTAMHKRGVKQTLPMTMTALMTNMMLW